MQDEVARLITAGKGHFLLESGHHGDMWLDLELLCLRPEPIQRLAAQIAARLAKHERSQHSGCFEFARRNCTRHHR